MSSNQAFPLAERGQYVSPVFSSRIYFSRLSIDGSKPTIPGERATYQQAAQTQQTSVPKTRQYKGTKAVPQPSLHPLGDINESSCSYARGPKHHQQDPRWCIVKELQTYPFWIRHRISMEGNNFTGEISLNGSTSERKWTGKNTYKVLDVSWVKFYFRETSILQAELS